MQVDFRSHPLFQEAEARTRSWLRPGTGETSTLSQLTTSPDGRRAAAAAWVCDKLEGAPSTRIALVDVASGDLEIVTTGPRSDSMPKWSPDGRTLAFLSDREQAYINRLRLLDVDSQTDRSTPEIAGFIEYLDWSPDGSALLLGVAAYGSELAGAQGARAVGLDSASGERPAWFPVVEGAPEATPWRSLWVYDLASDSVRRVTADGINIWQAVWCGRDHVAAICSDRPEETWWYSADVRLIAIDDGSARSLFQPADQLGLITATPSGAIIAVVEAVCSDRNIIAGDLRLIDTASGVISRPSSLGADVVQMHWRGEEKLLFAAGNGFDTVIGLHDRANGESREIWRARERSPSGTYFPEVSPLGDRPEDMLFLCEAFFEAPSLIAFEQGEERRVRQFGTPETSAAVDGLGSARDFVWTAPDGLEIQGWLLTPSGPGPHPVIMQVHGGPVAYYRPVYIGRSALPQMALAAGYAVFQPNPRGSSGRGQDFARMVFGDMGGGDTYDYLSGLDALQDAGIIDPARIGVTGGSYGGYISAWLITQDQRFAASVPVAPVTNWVSEHLTCNVPTFAETFLEDKLSNPTGKYFTRSPIHYVDRVKTPTLNICGALDKITPPGQALEFHRALQGVGIESALVTYPHEGHGVRAMPTVFDYVARVMAWFHMHMPPTPK